MTLTTAPADLGATENEKHDASSLATLSLKLAHLSDQEFLAKFASETAKHTGANIVMVGRYNPYSNLVRSLSLVHNNEQAEGIIYSLDGTPCERAIEDGVCVHKDNIAELYPRDRMLAELGARGYVGMPFFSPGGEPLGLIVTLCTKPLDNEQMFVDILERFRNRLAAAVWASEETLRHDWIAAEATDGVWDWDIVTGGTTVSKNLNSIFETGPLGQCDLSKIEDAIHPDDKKDHTDALQQHFKTSAPYDLKLRLRHKDGEYHWYHSRGKAMRNEAGKPVRMVGCFSIIEDLVCNLCDPQTILQLKEEKAKNAAQSA